MALIPATHENLEGPQATKPLTGWLVHAAKRRGTITYGQVKARLEKECGFDTVFTVAVGRVEDRRWAELVDEEALAVYAYTRWEELYREIYRTRLVVREEDGEGTERDERRPGGGGEGPNHRALRLRVIGEPGLVRRGLKAETTETEVELLWGDRVDVVSYASDRTVAIEVKSRDSNWVDLRREVYQCVKYRAVLAVQDIRRDPIVETWLVTESPLPGDLKALARRLGVRTSEVARD